jgi:hypothetical protein
MNTKFDMRGVQKKRFEGLKYHKKLALDRRE